MDTRIEIVAYTSDEKIFRKTIGDISTECERIEKLFSTTTTESSISRLNDRKEADRAFLDPEPMNLLKTSLEYAKETNGLFDITIAPVKWLWGLGTGQEPAIPDNNALAAVLKHVGWQNIKISSDTVYFSDSMIKVDLGGIAKGYSLAKLSSIMINNGIRSFLINAGGDVVLGDAKPDGTLWIIGIRHPRDGDAPIRKLQLKNISIVTSGDYERFFIVNNQRYHHIFVPSTGMPSRGVISATVIAVDPIRADVYSTTMMINGKMNITELPEGVNKIILIDDSLHVTEFEQK
jgi:thiamine biosynthesis lipoprotein